MTMMTLKDYVVISRPVKAPLPQEGSLATMLAGDGVPGVKLFGSHLTGLMDHDSDIDFIAGVDSDAEFDVLESKLHSLGFKDVGPTAEGGGMGGYDNSSGLDKDDPDPNLITVFKHGVDEQTPVKIDVIVVDRIEAQKRLRTLKLIAEFVERGDEDVRVFVKSQMKRNHVAWRALHKLVEAASLSS